METPRDAGGYPRYYARALRQERDFSAVLTRGAAIFFYILRRRIFPHPMEKLVMVSQSPLRIMRLNEVLDLTGLSRATLYRKIAAGTFPAQRKLAERCCGWRAGEVDVWLRNPVTFTLADLQREAA